MTTQYPVFEMAVADPDTEAESGSRWSDACPEWVLVVVYDHQAKVLAYCGRYFDYDGDDLLILVDSNSIWEEPNGLYIVEGAFVSDREWDGGVEEGAWQPDNTRPLTPAEWTAYKSDDEPWAPEFYAAPLQEPPTAGAPLPTAYRVEDLDDFRWYEGNDLVELCDPLEQTT